eukprot:gene26453-biopygen16516
MNSCHEEFATKNRKYLLHLVDGQYYIEE